MKETNKVKIEKYKGIDLFYSKEDGRVYFDFEGMERKVSYVFEARNIIDEPKWKACDLTGYFIDGTFNDYIGKAIATRKDIKSGNPEWKYKGRYDGNYKIPNYDKPKVFLVSKENNAVYKQFQEQRDIVNQEEKNLKSIIAELS